MRKQGTFFLPLFGSLPLLLEAHLALRISEIRKVNHFFSFAVFLPPSCFCSAALLLLLLPLQRQKERLAALLSFRVPRTTRPLALSPSSLLRRSSEGFQKSKRGAPPLPQRRERKGGRERGGTSGEVLRRGFFFAGTGDKSIGRFTPLFFFYPFSHTTVWRRCFAARCLRCSGDCSSCPIPLLPRQSSISCGAARRGQRASPLSTDDCDGDIRIRSRHRPPPPLSPLLLRLRRHRGDQQPSRPQPLDEQQQQLLLLLSSKQHRPRSWTRQ